MSTRARHGRHTYIRSAIVVLLAGATLLVACSEEPPASETPVFHPPTTARDTIVPRATTTVPRTTTPSTTPTTAPPSTAPTTTVPSSSVAPPAAAGTGKTWALAFSDDFDGSTLDAAKWTPCFSWAANLSTCTYSFNNGRERYQPGQVRLSGGTAKLVAEPVPGGDGGNPSKTYKSGLISTTNRPGQSGSLFSYQYGYAEARLKLPSQRGFFTAWWLLPPDPGQYNYAYEVDVLEQLGGGDRISHMTVHHSNRSDYWSANESAPNGACPTFDGSAGFHTYGFDWQPGSIDMYIDGQRCGRFTGPVWNGQLELILNLMVDVNWQRQTGVGLVDPTLSATLEVDYVKVWQRR